MSNVHSKPKPQNQSKPIKTMDAMVIFMVSQKNIYGEFLLVYLVATAGKAIVLVSDNVR